MKLLMEKTYYILSGKKIDRTGGLSAKEYKNK